MVAYNIRGALWGVEKDSSHFGSRLLHESEGCAGLSSHACRRSGGVQEERKWAVAVGAATSEGVPVPLWGGGGWKEV